MKKTASAVFFAVLRHGVAQKWIYSGLNLNQDKATKLQTVQIVRQGEATPYWFKVNPLYLCSARRQRSRITFDIV